MKIACLGWGSLIWNPEELPVTEPWRSDGPFLPVEFARQSRDKHITLVCVPGKSPVPTLWTFLKLTDLDQARKDLGKREGITKNINQHIGVWRRDQAVQDDSISIIVDTWARPLEDVDAVIWTNLPAKFQGVEGRVPASEEVVTYLSNLEGETRKKAEEYIRKAPRQIRTQYRSYIEQSLQWFPYDDTL